MREADGKVTSSQEHDPLASYLAEVRERADAATPGPWWSDESEQCWRLHGVHAVIPAQMFPGTGEVMIPEQVMNHQILKAAKRGTTMAEYWPGEADDAFITSARSDVPRLLGALEAALTLADGWVANSAAVPLIDREAAGLGIRAVITAELLDAKETAGG